MPVSPLQMVLPAQVRIRMTNNLTCCMRVPVSPICAGPLASHTLAVVQAPLAWPCPGYLAGALRHFTFILLLLPLVRVSFDGASPFRRTCAMCCMNLFECLALWCFYRGFASTTLCPLSAFVIMFMGLLVLCGPFSLPRRCAISFYLFCFALVT